MQRLNGPYAQWFNWSHRRSGHLGGARYYAVPVTTDGHELQLLRYLARNPFLEDFALPMHCDDGGSHMKKPFVALLLMVGAAAMVASSAPNGSIIHGFGTIRS